jgi:hypothetical protein
MARYGLGNVDFNKRAQLALLGASREPARDLEQLLNSGQPIEDKTRYLLAELFAGHLEGVAFKFSNGKSHRTLKIGIFSLPTCMLIGPRGRRMRQSQAHSKRWVTFLRNSMKITRLEEASLIALIVKFGLGRKSNCV